MWTLFQKGGPIMWPLLLTSLVALTVVIERLIFLVREQRLRQPDVVELILSHVEKGKPESAIKAGESSSDFVARTLVYGLTHRKPSFSNALLLAANRELKR